MRILYFEANTDLVSLIWLPLFSGLILALVFPWTAVVGAWMAKLPKAKLHSIQFSEASKRRITEYVEEAREEEAKAHLEAVGEQRKIDAAKRLDEAGSVSDELEAEITGERRRIGSSSTESEMSRAFKELNELEVEILLGAAKSPTGLVLKSDSKILFQNISKHDITFNDHRREKIKVDNAFSTLSKKGYLTKTRTVTNDTVSGTEYLIEESAYALADFIERMIPH